MWGHPIRPPGIRTAFPLAVVNPACQRLQCALRKPLRFGTSDNAVIIRHAPGPRGRAGGPLAPLQHNGRVMLACGGRPSCFHGFPWVRISALVCFVFPGGRTVKARRGLAPAGRLRFGAPPGRGVCLCDRCHSSRKSGRASPSSKTAPAPLFGGAIGPLAWGHHPPTPSGAPKTPRHRAQTQNPVITPRKIQRLANATPPDFAFSLQDGVTIPPKQKAQISKNTASKFAPCGDRDASMGFCMGKTWVHLDARPRPAHFRFPWRAGCEGAPRSGARGPPSTFFKVGIFLIKGKNPFLCWG